MIVSGVGACGDARGDARRLHATPGSSTTRRNPSPVEVISASQLSQITKGEKTAREAKPDAKPRADKVAERPGG